MRRAQECAQSRKAELSSAARSRPATKHRSAFARSAVSRKERRYNLVRSSAGARRAVSDALRLILQLFAGVYALRSFMSCTSNAHVRAVKIHFITSCGCWHFCWPGVTIRHLTSSGALPCDFLFIMLSFLNLSSWRQGLFRLQGAGSQFAQDEFLHYRAQFALSGVDGKLRKD